jgi:hypothetical protein
LAQIDPLAKLGLRKAKMFPSSAEGGAKLCGGSGDLVHHMRSSV